MKTFDFFKTCKKGLSVKKYIKPVFSQEMYNTQHYVRHKDKRRMEKNPFQQSIIPAEIPSHPDDNKTLGLHDEKNHHFMYFFHKKNQEMENRVNRHIQYAKTTLDAKRKHKAMNKAANDMSEMSDSVKVHPKTGFMLGVGYDDFYTTEGSEETNEIPSDLNDLVSKLGYLDMRDFVALNKYILEAQSHEDLVNQTKARFLTMAIKKLSDQKKDEIRSHFKKIDEKNQNLSSKERTDIKIEHMLESIPESKDLFYKNYYQLKEMNEREERQTLNQFEKYEKLMKSLNNPKFRKLDKDEYYTDSKDTPFQYDMQDYMERMIKAYRDERTKEIKSDSTTIINKVKEFFQTAPNLEGKDESYVMDTVINLCKYQTLIPKYKKLYTPTNVETERLMNKYLREKRLKEFTFEKMMEEEDPYFSPLTDEDDVKIEGIVDEESKRLAMEKHQMKKNYFEAKFEYRKKKLEEDIDKQLAEELGITIAQKAFQEKDPEILEIKQADLIRPPDTGMGFIEKFLNDHYKSYKADYMYNYADFFSNKYKVRRRIAEEMKSRVSLGEISYILDSLVTGDKGVKDFKGQKATKHTLYDFVNSQYGVVKPSFIETLTEGKSEDPSYDKELSNSVKTAIKNVETKPLELSEGEVFEMELYKGIKNDPYYKHYLYTHFAYFSETMNDIISGLPHIIKGYKPSDMLKYEDLRVISNKKTQTFESSKAISDVKSDMLDSLTLNVNAMIERSQENQKKKRDNEVYKGTGKRKRAVAYAELRKGSGKMTVNGKEFYDYFNFSMLRGRVLIPLQITDTICSYDVKLTIQGGGVVGQADAAIPAISKALLKIDPSWRPVLAKNLLLKHDPRNVEPKKPGKIKARKGYVYNRR